ncbi:MAG: nascent polypeptide-associated complex protein, partial [Candidatus Diapherotrites archaeon]|nr:nascent polypeptide-associated complex protein [Candidatus Diapherotrites archaeon]
MFPGMAGMNPAQLKSMMKQLGIKSDDLKVNRVVFEMDDKNLFIAQPSVTTIEMQGQRTFQVL